MQSLPIKVPMELMQTRWASILNPILGIPMLSGNQLLNIFIPSGVATPINHLLDRTPQGWLLTDLNAAANVWRAADFNNKTLILESDTDVTISLWVY